MHCREEAGRVQPGGRSVRRGRQDRRFATDAGEGPPANGQSNLLNML